MIRMLLFCLFALRSVFSDTVVESMGKKFLINAMNGYKARTIGTGWKVCLVISCSKQDEWGGGGWKPTSHQIILRGAGEFDDPYCKLLLGESSVGFDGSDNW